MDISELSPDARGLWHRVETLWSMLGGDDDAIRAAMHPRYTGWVVGEAVPHDRETGVRSAADGTRVRDVHLEPLRVEVYDRTGVVHYTYRASVAEGDTAPRVVSGRWTETYVNHDGAWLLVAVSGGPDPD